MKVSFLSSQGNAALLRRLQFFGFRVQLDTPENIKAIGIHSTDLVYLIEEALTHTKAWSDLRVRLARAGRYYIVTGSNMGSREIMNAARDGAHDVLDEDDSDVRWQEAIEHAVQSQQLWWQLYGGGSSEDSDNLVGRSHSITNIREACRRLGPTDATVLLIGDSGTGKERVAEALHEASGSPKLSLLMWLQFQEILSNQNFLE